MAAVTKLLCFLDTSKPGYCLIFLICSLYLSVVCRGAALCSSFLPPFLPFYVFCICMIARPLQATANMNFTLKRKKMNVCFSDHLKLVTHHFYSIICCCGSLQLSHAVITFLSCSNRFRVFMGGTRKCTVGLLWVS